MTIRQVAAPLETMLVINIRWNSMLCKTRSLTHAHREEVALILVAQHRREEKQGRGKQQWVLGVQG